MDLKLMKKQLAKTVRNYNKIGWSPATSTNYSFRDDDKQIWVSRSGVDKREFSKNDFITVDLFGRSSGKYQKSKPSAETLIHTTLYALFPETQVILHSHSVYPVLISQINNSFFEVEDYEIQKGFQGESTHINRLSIPIIQNDQDMQVFTEMLRSHQKHLKNHCFIIKNHGTYAWGRDLFEAKRHLETLEYLCKCEWMAHSKTKNL